MGSLRNPIGPLPSSIYWRRRAVALALLALTVLLVMWGISLGGGSGDQKNSAGGGDNSRGPTDPITPGATDSKPPVTDRPGGRDEVNGGTGSGGGEDGSGGSGGSGGSTGADGSGGDAAGGGSGSGGSGGALAGSSGSLTGGDGLPAGPGLADCSSSDVEVGVQSVENEYGPGDTPKVKLTLRTDGDSACRVDLGRTATVVTVTDAEGDRVWSSADCPPGRAAAWIEVPADGTTTHTLTWDRERSKPECATPSGGKVPAGNYLVEVKVAGLSTEQTSFVLTKD
ncbi:hypothetical protein N566_28055 [Streptomycetaceae bacterium MP113-05]|nr:hypothetical protein N566_28055 [Streptomycetaceae bacterium MP113-05]